MSKVTTGVRIVYGLLFLVFGLNGFLNFLPPQGAPPPDAGAFLGGLAAAGYMFPLIKGTEVIGGLLLLSNRLVPLALVLLAPIVVNIVAFHLFLAPAGLGMTLAFLAAELFLAWRYHGAWRGVLQVNAEPEPVGEARHRAPAVA